MPLSHPVREVIVVGAGPAGVAAGIRLRRLGIDCLVLEKAPGPRVKQCGGAVSPYAVRLYAELGLTEDYFRQHARGTNEGWINGFGVELLGHTSNGVHGYFVERRQLDWDFQQAAISAGVPIEYDCEVIDISLTGDGVSVKVRKDGETAAYFCRFLVAADGATSRIRTHLAGGKIPEKHRILTSSAILDCASYETGVIRFHEDWMPTYTWVFPYVGNRVNVGIGVYAKVYERVGSRATLEEIISRATGLRCEGKLGKWVINTNPVERRVFGGRVLLAGDAGGFVDALTGEGIGFALRSGMACADAIASIRKFGPIASCAYTARMTWVVLRLLSSKMLQLSFSRFPKLAGFFLRWCSRNRTARRMVFWYFSNS